MTKTKLNKSLIFIAIGATFAMGIIVWQKVQAFISQGLSSSQQIRVSQSNNCSDTQKDGQHFSGCNSIL